MAPVVSGGTTSTGVYCGPPDGRGCSPERSNHGVKQLRSDHVSTTAEYAIAPIARLANGHDLARSGRYWKSVGPTKTQLTALPFSAPRPSAPSSCPASYRKAPPDRADKDHTRDCWRLQISFKALIKTSAPAAPKSTPECVSGTVNDAMLQQATERREYGMNGDGCQ